MKASCIVGMLLSLDVSLYLSCSQLLSAGKIPVRLYIRTIDEDIGDIEDAAIVDSWEKISYINHPVEVHGEGKNWNILSLD